MMSSRKAYLLDAFHEDFVLLNRVGQVGCSECQVFDGCCRVNRSDCLRSSMSNALPPRTAAYLQTQGSPVTGYKTTLSAEKRTDRLLRGLPEREQYGRHRRRHQRNKGSKPPIATAYVRPAGRPAWHFGRCRRVSTVWTTRRGER